MKSKSVPIFLDRRRVASVTGDTLRRSLSGKKHLLNGEAVCYRVEILAQAKTIGATKVEIKDRDNGKIYLASIDLFETRGFTIKNAFGEQRCLNLSHFDQIGTGKVKPKKPIDPKPLDPMGIEASAGEKPSYRVEPEQNKQLQLFQATSTF